MSKLSRYKGEANFTIANVIQSISSMVMGVVAAACIAPEDFGVYQSIILISTYATFMHLGVFNGLNRNLAYYKAQGNIEKMQLSVDTSYTVAGVNAITGFLVGSGILLYLWIGGYSTFYLWSGAYLFISMVLTPFSTHFACTYRSGQEFGRLGTLKNIQSTVFCLLSILPYFLGLIGKVIADMSNCIVGYLLLRKKTPYPARTKGSIQSLKELLSVGFPLLLGGYIWQMFIIADMTYIATHMSPESMGLYTIAGYCISLFMVLPMALNTLLYPKAAARYGETGDKRVLLPFWRKSLLLFSAVLVPLVVVAYFVIPWAVEVFLPNYEDGIEAARISLLTCLTFVYLGPSVIFGTLKKNYGYIAMISCCFGAFWFTTRVWNEYFQSIESVAYLRFVLSFVLMIYTIVHTYIIIKK